MKNIDINSDLGESFGAYTMGNDAEVLRYVTSANIACGFHASDPLTMQKAVRQAKEAGVKIGAHPGYPDLVGFGRRELKVSPAELKAMVIYQVGALQAVCKAEGTKLHHVKPHGAMYNMAAKDEKLADAIAEAVAAVDGSLTLMGLSGSCMKAAAEKHGLAFAAEVFADRAYEDDGSLVSRTKPGAMIEDEDLAIRRMLHLLETGTIESGNGKEIRLEADTICVHGDSPKAVLFAKKLREALTAK